MSALSCGGDTKRAGLWNGDPRRPVGSAIRSAHGRRPRVERSGSCRSLARAVRVRSVQGRARKRFAAGSHNIVRLLSSRSGSLSRRLATGDERRRSTTRGPASFNAAPTRVPRDTATTAGAASQSAPRGGPTSRSSCSTWGSAQRPDTPLSVSMLMGRMRRIIACGRPSFSKRTTRARTASSRRAGEP